ncbi:MAG TPA: TIGR03618 family F420-dependent PPOX class oxidoreductase [Acidimicrobiia bacterium]|nr:TIGR03618 family F420-dependent PPOX class oxidoreductase [Acidimicrobiia bacterium]
MGYDPAALPDEVLAFLAERHLATLTTLAPGGWPHVVAVGFAFDPQDGLVRIITGGSSRKAANGRRGGRAAVAQVDGARWLSLEGPVAVTDDPTRVAAAVAAYTARYRDPGENPARVAIEISVERVLGRA